MSSRLKVMAGAGVLLIVASIFDHNSTGIAMGVMILGCCWGLSGREKR